MEETGYDIKQIEMQKIAVVFVTPGYSSELLHLYYAEVRTGDKKESGGGLPQEQEFIEVVELPLQEFIRMFTAAETTDLKTLTAGLWLIQKQNKLNTYDLQNPIC